MDMTWTSVPTDGGGNLERLKKLGCRCVFCAEIPVKSSGPPVAENTSFAPNMDATPDFKSYIVLGGGQPFANAKCMSL